MFTYHRLPLANSDLIAFERIDFEYFFLHEVIFHEHLYINLCQIFSHLIFCSSGSVRFSDIF